MASIANPFSLLGDDSDDEGSNTRTNATKVSRKETKKPRTQNANVATDKARKKGGKQKNSQRGGKDVGTTRKREKDRHVSGTGRGKGTSKGGAGSRNWGTEADELAADQDVAAERNQDYEEAAEPEEPEAPTMSYDEYMASKGGNKKVEKSFKSFNTVEKKGIDAIFERKKVKKERKKKTKRDKDGKKSKKERHRVRDVIQEDP